VTGVQTCALPIFGYKGIKSNKSITKIVANSNNANDRIAEIDLTEEFGTYNSAVTLDMSCYNNDGNNNCSIKARGVDMLGNIGSEFIIHYKK
jgi:hypothetical protein